MLSCELFPSVYDTNGIVVREAAACGLASVLIKDSCAAEGITHDRNGFIIEENSHSMAVLLEEVSKDLSHVAQVGQNAMDEIYISWDESVKDARNRYDEILKKNEIRSKRYNLPIDLINSIFNIIHEKSVEQQLK